MLCRIGGVGILDSFPGWGGSEQKINTGLDLSFIPNHVTSELAKIIILTEEAHHPSIPCPM